MKKFYQSDKTLAACYYCVGSIGKEQPHQLLDKAGLESGIKEDHSDVLSLIDTNLLYWQYKNRILYGKVGKDFFHSFLISWERNFWKVLSIFGLVGNRIKLAWKSKKQKALPRWVKTATVFLTGWAAVLTLLCLTGLFRQFSGLFTQNSIVPAIIGIIALIPLWLPFLLTRSRIIPMLLALLSIGIAICEILLK